MPSTNSISWLSVLPSLTVIDPWSPTFSIKVDNSSPISLSPLALIVATWLIYSLPLTCLDILLSSLTTSSTARLIPLLRSIGFIPAATLLQPSLNILLASTVEVVVPSPASSLVLEATYFSSWAPMFICLFLNSMLLATVTPSLVILGAPKV